MGQTLTEKILSAHLVEGEMVKGSEIGIRITKPLHRTQQVQWHILSLRLWVCQE